MHQHTVKAFSGKWVMGDALALTADNVEEPRGVVQCLGCPTPRGKRCTEYDPYTKILASTLARTVWHGMAWHACRPACCVGVRVRVWLSSPLFFCSGFCCLSCFSTFCLTSFVQFRGCYCASLMLNVLLAFCSMLCVHHHGMGWHGMAGDRTMGSRWERSARCSWRVWYQPW